MRNPLRWLMYAQWLALVGGRAAFERAIGGRGAVVGVRQPMGLTPEEGAHDAVARAPRAALFRDMFWGARAASAASAAPRGGLGGGPGGALAPAAVASEAGSFLLFALAPDTAAAHFATAARLSVQNRPPTGPAADGGAAPGAKRATAPGGEGGALPPSFLPGLLQLSPRMLAHPELGAPRALRADGGVEVGAPPSIPLWRMSADRSTWHFVGFRHFGGAGAGGSERARAN
jgi:hypothetical protein